MKLALTFSCLALAASAAVAQAPAQRILNKDELRACMTNDTKLAERVKALNDRVPVVKTQLEAIRTEGEALRKEREAIREDDVRMQIRMRGKMEEYNKRVADGNKAAEQIQADRAAFDKDLDAYNAACTGVSFKNEDKLAVQKELEAAKK